MTQSLSVYKPESKDEKTLLNYLLRDLSKEVMKNAAYQ